MNLKFLKLFITTTSAADFCVILTIVFKGSFTRNVCVGFDLHYTFLDNTNV